MDSISPGKIDPRVRLVMLRIEANLKLKIPFEHLAREVNLSVSRLRHLFKAEIGLTPSQYAKTLRLNAARELAANSFLNVKEIVSKLGNIDQSHFLRDFKRSTGQTLTQYRESILRRHS
jgi:transcriptional regulator GlxA family with amidase domain